MTSHNMRTHNGSLRVGVVGVGHLGRLHVQKYAAQSDATLVGVVDIDEGPATQVAAQYNTTALIDYRELFGQVECVSIAVPTQLHYAITRDFLQHGVDVLVEKPLTATGAEGRELVDIAAQADRICKLAIWNALIQPYVR